MAKKPLGGTWYEQDIIPPPSNLTVHERPPQPLLYRADGTPLVRRPPGFQTKGDR
jgi:hypothetical protein